MNDYGYPANRGNKNYEPFRCGARAAGGTTVAACAARRALPSALGGQGVSRVRRDALCADSPRADTSMSGVEDASGHSTRVECPA